jgi:uncharacterized membrane protein SpoIIM required for sporulation
MKETSFIKQNINKWTTYEGEIQKKKKDPALVSRLFVQITDDLSYAQTFYKNRSVRVYLNGIAQLLFNDINKGKRIKFSSFVEFWKTDLPVIMYKIRYELLFSFAFFMICVGIGIITSAHDADFARKVMGDSYIDMTLENIKSNDAMAVYKQRYKAYSFMYITINNIKVAFITFVFGILFGVGTLISLLRNGIMLGSFQYFFIERNLFRESFLTIWQHGTLEISSIVIAGAAGFTIGRGLLIPGTYTRMQSLRITARRGLKIMIGLIPVFILAAFIEAFFTRYTWLPGSLRLMTIILSLGFVLFYFVFYPGKVAKKYSEKLEIDDRINSTDNKLPDLTAILNNELLFGGTLLSIKRMLPALTKIILASSLVTGIIAAVGQPWFMPSLTETLYEHGHTIRFLLDYKEMPYLFLLHTLFLSVIIHSLVGLYGKLTRKAQNPHTERARISLSIINSLLTATVLQIVFFLPIGWALLLILITAPFLFLNLQVCIAERKFFPGGFGKTMNLISKSFGRFFFLNMKFSILGGLVLFLLSPTIYGELLNLIKWNLWLEDVYVTFSMNLISLFIFYTSISIAIVLLLTSDLLVFYSMKELATGHNLLEKVKKIGIKNTLRGYEFED